MTFEEQRAIIQGQRDIVIQDELISEEKRAELLANLDKAEKSISDKKAAHKKKQIREFDQLASNASKLAGERTAAGKGLGIAAAMINTYQGASEALKQESTLPS